MLLDGAERRRRWSTPRSTCTEFSAVLIVGTTPHRPTLAPPSNTVSTLRLGDGLIAI